MKATLTFLKDDPKWDMEMVFTKSEEWTFSKDKVDYITETVSKFAHALRKASSDKTLIYAMPYTDWYRDKIIGSRYVFVDASILKKVLKELCLFPDDREKNLYIFEFRYQQHFEYFKLIVAKLDMFYRTRTMSFDTGKGNTKEFFGIDI